jgi:hypothetical protein
MAILCQAFSVSFGDGRFEKSVVAALRFDCDSRMNWLFDLCGTVFLRHLEAPLEASKIGCYQNFRGKSAKNVWINLQTVLSIGEMNYPAMSGCELR